MATLEIERDGRVLVVWVHNPPHNFMDRGMVIELDALVGELKRDRSIGSVVITGRPPDLFITHYDVAEILAGVEDVGVTPGPRAAGALLAAAAAVRRVPGLRDLAQRTPLRGLLELHRIHDVFLGMNRLDKVVIAAINGPATGGGCELSLASDLRYIADRPGVRIGLPEMTMGFNPGAGGTQRLARALGPGPALEAMLEGRTFTPAEALDRRSPGSVRALKAAVYEGASRSLPRGLAEERRRFMSVGGTEPARRAMTTFVAEVDRRGGSPWADPEGIVAWQEGAAEDLGNADAPD